MKNLITFIVFSLLFLVANANAQEKQASKIVTDYFTWVDAGNTDAITKNLLAENFSFSAPFSPVPLDKNGWTGTSQAFKLGFPNMMHQIKSWFADDNRVAVQAVFTGKNTGALMGNPPTNNSVLLPFITIFELDGKGKIKSLTTSFDQKSFESQLMAGINPNTAAEAAVRGILEASDAGNIEQLITFFTPDARHYFGGQANTNDELKKRVAGFKAGFPDIKRVISELIVNNGIVTVRGSFTGTNTGSFMGKAPTNNKVSVTVLGLYKVNAQGKVTEAWVELDGSSIQKQLMGGM